MKNKSKEKLGLTTKEAIALQQEYGKNELVSQEKESLIMKIFHIISEPMFLLLLGASIIYFILGEPRDGIIMLVFVIGVMGIEVIQEWKTDRTLNALKDLSVPHITVLRDGIEKEIESINLVPGDVMKIYEGIKIPADGRVLECSGLCVNESTLTGETNGIWKQEEADDSSHYWKADYCYAGTHVTQGSALILVDKIGISTEYGKIGQSILEAPVEVSPLQKQINKLIKVCTWIALSLFLFVGLFTFANLSDVSITDRIVQSILSGITLAMAMIPEEFPVILTVFLSMGAWRLAKKNSLVKNLNSVQTLGEVSVLCVDKTGTITENKMKVQAVTTPSDEMYKLMSLSCNNNVFDSMEKAILESSITNGFDDSKKAKYQLVKHYAFTNETKMMGQIWKSSDEEILAVKGSSEQVLALCHLTKKEQEDCQLLLNQLMAKGLRVLSVARQKITDSQPEMLYDAQLEFVGFIGLNDPVKQRIKEDIEMCHEAGIRLIMITGDSAGTAGSIAKEVGISSDYIITGEQLDSMNEQELQEKVKKTSIFARVIPEHKMKIVKALKMNNEIVAMTGDGVNDAPALKYADIGISMGERGNDVTKESADLILMDDNFSTIVDTIKDGRRIYENIRKAIGYVLSIHIPIALASLLAPIFGIAPSAVLLLPIHVVLLELIIDPTCSIILERQPAEDNIMRKKPRKASESILNLPTLVMSIIQGIAIFISSFGIYYGALTMNRSVFEARSLGLSTLLLSNIFLVLTISSHNESVFKTIRKLSKDKVMWVTVSAIISMLSIVLYTPINTFLKLAPLSWQDVLVVLFITLVSVFWHELVKTKIYKQK